MSRFGREWSLGAKNVLLLQIFPFFCATLCNENAVMCHFVCVLVSIEDNSVIKICWNVNRSI
jgi:hypothetical protein